MNRLNKIAGANAGCPSFAEKAVRLLRLAFFCPARACFFGLSDEDWM